MKRKNGKNIITSDDITLVGNNKYSGKSLHDVLDELSTDHEKLKSNVKWIYKYGGVGSGRGGGGGVSSSWSLGCTLGGQPIRENNTISLSSRGSYDLVLHINNAGSANYKVTYKYGNRNPQTVSLSFSENNSTVIIPLNLQDNGEIQISATSDQDDNMKTLFARYVVEAFKLECNLVDSRGVSYIPSNNIYTFGINDVVENGLYLSLVYTNVTDDNNIQINYTTISGNSYTETGTLEKVQNKEFLKDENGNWLVSLIDILDFNDDNAGEYPISIDVSVGGIQQISSNYLCSFIPSSTYLQVFPVSGEIYKSENISNPSEYYTGDISFYVTPYQGVQNFGRNCTISCKVFEKVNGNWEEIIEDGWNKISVIGQDEQIINYYNSISTTERKSTRYTINITKIGTIKIIFHLDIAGTFQENFEYYLFTKQVENTVNWYYKEDKGFAPDIRIAYRYNLSSDDINLKQFLKVSSGTSTTLNNGSLIEQSSTDREIELRVPNSTSFNSNTKYNFIFSIGLQFNKINDDDIEILKFYDNDSGGTNELSLRQNAVFFGGNSIGTQNIFINKEENYDVLSTKNYHLVNICRRLIDSQVFEYSVYVDGIISAVTLSSFDNTYKQISINKGNFSINLLEMDYYDTSKTTSKISDANVVNYWYSYKEKLIRESVNSEDVNLISYIGEGFTHEYDNNGHVEIDSNNLGNIVSTSKIPSMLLKYTKRPSTETSEGTPDFFIWSDQSYDENEDVNPIDVSVAWTLGNGNGFKDVNTTFTELDNAVGQFQIKVQGSSTKGFKSKNYDLSIEGSGDVKFLYTPRFNANKDPENPQSKEYTRGCFLPDEVFTLKADIVDSSHTNNTCLGHFINDVTTPFNPPTLGNLSQNSLYTDYIRNALEGFPILLFLEYDNEGDIKYYYLGIYNFNLGRKSRFNLGYYNLNLLRQIIGDSEIPNNQFTVIPYKTSEVPLQLYNDLVIAEVQNNVNLFDFSNYDDTLLFSQNVQNGDKEHSDEVKGTYMFGDIIGNSEITKSTIKNFVKNTSNAGGYLFGRLGKQFKQKNDQSGYKSRPGEVPNPAIQYKRRFTASSETEFYIEEPLTQQEIETKLSEITGNSLSVKNYILDHLDSNNENEEPAFVNYSSLLEYYTICMVFCMLDSVQKNLNIKSWNSGKTFYLAFYDMDTCLGVDNDGFNSTYFAFSDYWDIDDPQEDSSSTPTNKVYKITPVSIYRDYCPPTEMLDGVDTKMFDAPSSYLFAVAKYARQVLLKDLQSEEVGEIQALLTPSDLWAKWRANTGGILKNADAFIDNYFARHMQGVNEMMFNFNYRTKYIFRNGQSLSGDIVKFHGYRKFYIKDWLTKRFHILDAYFNLSSAASSILENSSQDLSLQIYEPSPSNLISSMYDYKNNSDVTICRDIFAGGGTKTYNKLDFTVSAPDFTPLVIQSANSVYRYLLNKSSVKYRIINNIESSGVHYALGGSGSWNYLKSIDPAATGDILSVESDNLTSLNGNSGTITGWNLKVPSLKELHLNSSNYSGNLTFQPEITSSGEVDKFPNLSVIDISGSKVGLTINKENVTRIDASNLKGSDVLSIKNCKKLTSLSLSGDINSIDITNWTENFTFSGLQSQSIQIEATGQSLIFNHKSDNKITNISISGFKDVTVEACSSLLRLTIGAGVQTVKIKGCSNLANNLSIKADNLKELDLSDCVNLSEFNLIYSNIDNASNLYNLNLSNTLVSKCNILNDNGSSISGVDTTYNGHDMLDLRKMTNENLQITCSSNQGIEYIHLYNQSVPTRMCKLNSFWNCQKLLRVFGSFATTNSSTFKDCKLFTLQGTEDELWKGRSKKENGKTLTPFEIIDKQSLINQFDNCIFTFGLQQGFLQSGNYTTNMLVKSTSNTQFFANTSCTVFDAYYFLNSLAFNENSYIIDNTFQNIGGKLSNVDSPNKYMFHGCHRVTYIHEMFNGSISGGSVFTLESPENINNESGKDNGFFSHLKSIKTLDNIFPGANMQFNRNILRRVQGTYPLIHFGHMSISNLLPLEGEDDSHIGDMTDFFENTPNISELIAILNFSTIKYSTLRIPNSISIVRGCFRNSYANVDNGEKFDWDNIFDSGKIYDKLVDLSNSFNLNNVNNNKKLEFEIYDGMFDRMPNLEYIGYRYATDGSGGNVTDNKEGGDVEFSFGFHGSGFDKKFRGNNFTYNIVKNLPKLQSFVGFFSETSGASIDFPVHDRQSMFSNNTELTNIASLFQNSICTITLYGNGFVNCRKLQNVNKLFYNSVVRDGKSGTITSSIPYKFFYTGKNNDITKNYYVITSDEYNRLSQTTQDDDFYNSHLKSVLITQFNRSIQTMSECFFGQDSMQHYTMDSQDLVLNNLSYYEDRIPLPQNGYSGTYYYKQSISDSWTSKQGVDPEYDMSLIYDGNRNNINNNYYCEDKLDIIIGGNDAIDYNNRKQAIFNYFCPPDLLAYTDNSPNTNIKGMFKRCGFQSSTSSYSPKKDSSINAGYQAGGIKGRICPYLFKPLSSLTHITEFFEWCKGLIEYRYRLSGQQEVFTELIPHDIFKYNKQMKGLAKAFSGMYFYNDFNTEFLNNIRNNALDIRGIFSNCYFEGISEISGVFRGITIDSPYYAFNRTYVLLDDNGQTCSPFLTAQSPSLISQLFSVQNFSNNFVDCFNHLSTSARNRVLVGIYFYTNSNFTETGWSDGERANNG